MDFLFTKKTLKSLPFRSHEKEHNDARDVVCRNRKQCDDQEASRNFRNFARRDRYDFLQFSVLLKNIATSLS